MNKEYNYTFNDIEEWYKETINLIPMFPGFDQYGNNNFEENKKEFYKTYPELKNEKLTEIAGGGIFAPDSSIELIQETNKTFEKSVKELFINNHDAFKKAVINEFNERNYYYRNHLNHDMVLFNLSIDKDFLIDNDLTQVYFSAVIHYLKEFEKVQNG